MGGTIIAPHFTGKWTEVQRGCLAKAMFVIGGTGTSISSNSWSMPKTTLLLLNLYDQNSLFHYCTSSKSFLPSNVEKKVLSSVKPGLTARAMVLSAPPPPRPGDTWESGDTFDWLDRGGGCCSHLMGRHQGCRSTSYIYRAAPAIKNCPEQNVNNDSKLSPPRTKIFPPFLFSTTAFKSIDSLHPKTFLKFLLFLDLTSSLQPPPPEN